MPLQQYQRRKLSLTAKLISALVKLLGLSAGKPLNPRQFSDLVETLTGTTNTARDQVAALAFEYYLERRPEGFEDIDAPNLNPYPPEYFEKVLQSHRANLEDEEHAQAGVTRVTQAAVRTVDNAAREVVQATTQYDPAATGRWARVLTGAESCGWCAMLASRGPVYESADTAGQGDEWHLGCDCIVVPVFKGHMTEWEGYEEYKKLEKLWADSTKDTGGKSALKAFDRAFAKEDPTSYSPITRVN